MRTTNWKRELLVLLVFTVIFAALTASQTTTVKGEAAPFFSVFPVALILSAVAIGFSVLIASLFYVFGLRRGIVEPVAAAFVSVLPALVAGPIALASLGVGAGALIVPVLFASVTGAVCGALYWLAVGRPNGRRRRKSDIGPATAKLREMRGSQSAEDEPRL